MQMYYNVFGNSTFVMQILGFFRFWANQSVKFSEHSQEIVNFRKLLEFLNSTRRLLQPPKHGTDFPTVGRQAVTFFRCA